MEDKSVQKNSEDFDLISLIIFFKKKIYKWRILIIASIILGIALGGISYLYTPKTYISRMVVSSSYLKGSAFIVIIDDVNKYIGENNVEAMKQLLNIDETSIKEIKGLKVFPAKKFVERQLNTDVSDYEREEDITEFVIEASVSNNNVLPELERGLLYYLQNNVFMKKNGSIYKKELANTIEKIDNELMIRYAFQKTLNDMYISGNYSKLSGLEIDINDWDKAAFYKLRMETQDKLILADVQAIESFMPYKKPKSPKLMFSVISGLFIAIILCILIITVMEFNNKIKGREESNSNNS